MSPRFWCEGMNRWIEIFNETQGKRRLVRARWCASHLCRLRGLMFRRSLEEGTGLLLVDSRESRVGAAIHMWAVFFPLGVVWLDAGLRVVDQTLALPWRMYTPRAAAQFILEAHPSLLEEVAHGDRLEFVHETPD